MRLTGMGLCPDSQAAQGADIGAVFNRVRGGVMSHRTPRRPPGLAGSTSCRAGSARVA